MKSWIFSLIFTHPSARVGRTRKRTVGTKKTAVHKMRTAALFTGWKIGIEPTTSGTTIQRSNQLSYIHRLGVQIYNFF
jgi:hypothetical protein